MKESHTPHHSVRTPLRGWPTLSGKQQAALYSLLASLLLLIVKLLVGWHAASLGILAEAAHSGLDLVATLLTWISIRIAERPADANHPFGHGKFENFSALLQTVLLAVTAMVIGYTAARQWWGGAVGTLHLDVWAYAVMAVSLLVDWRRVGVLRRAAVTFGSDALEADALNFATDMAGSAAVLAGLVAVAMSHTWQLPWLRHGDAAAAMAVAALMLSLAVRLGRRTAGVLLDEAPPALSGDLRMALQGVEGVADLERLRLRRVGRRYFVDLRMALEPATTLQGADKVRAEVAGRIHRRLPEADVVVETQPRPPAAPGPLEKVQAVALNHNLNIHDLAIYDVGAGLDVEFHLELDQNLELARAHDLVSKLEAEMRSSVTGIRQILTHIEPASARISSANLLDLERVTGQVQAATRTLPEILDCHDLQLRRTGGHLSLSCHCTFPDAMPVDRVHELATALESAIKRSLPELFRVTIHPEPGSDNRR